MTNFQKQNLIKTKAVLDGLNQAITSLHNAEEIINDVDTAPIVREIVKLKNKIVAEANADETQPDPETINNEIKSLPVRY